MVQLVNTSSELEKENGTVDEHLFGLGDYVSDGLTKIAARLAILPQIP